MMPSPFIVLLAAALGLSVCLVRAQQALQVGYPSQPPVVCGMTQLLWSSSVGKTNVSVVAAENHDRVWRTFQTQPDRTFSLTWNPISVPAGQDVQVQVTDRYSTALSPVLHIGQSDTTSCLSSSSSSESSSDSSDPSSSSSSSSSSSGGSQSSAPTSSQSQSQEQSQGTSSGTPTTTGGGGTSTTASTSGAAHTFEPPPLYHAVLAAATISHLLLSVNGYFDGPMTFRSSRNRQRYR